MKKPIILRILLMTFNFDTPCANNEAIGKYVEINGAEINYEKYGKGEPLLLIHRNGGYIESFVTGNFCCEQRRYCSRVGNTHLSGRRVW